MRINKRSWHYRWMVDILKFQPPDTLCQYFWKLVGSFPLALITIALLPLLFCMWPFIWVSEKIRDWYYNWDFDYQEGNNVIIASFRAFKSKVCPIIEYYDDKKNNDYNDLNG